VTRLPDQQPTAPQAGQPTVNDNARKFLADLESAYAAEQTQTPTAVHVTDPTIPSWQDGPRIGTTPPVPQPGKPPMSQTAANVSGVMVASSLPILALGGAATGILWASGHADPTVVGCIVAAPAALAVPILALSRLLKRAKETVEAAPPVIHQTYTGNVQVDVDARTVHSKNSGVWASTRNQLPAGQ
jgi:hypothetical protein